MSCKNKEPGIDRDHICVCTGAFRCSGCNISLDYKHKVGRRVYNIYSVSDTHGMRILVSDLVTLLNVKDDDGAGGLITTLYQYPGLFNVVDVPNLGLTFNYSHIADLLMLLPTTPCNKDLKLKVLSELELDPDMIS